MPRMSLLGTAILTVAAGLMIGLVLFAVTAPNVTYLGVPIGRPAGTDFISDYGGTDPWTGEFRPLTWSWTDTTGERVTRFFWPDGYQNYRAIPVPVGFVVGGLLTLPVIAGIRRPRKTASGAAASAA